jgi:hypothetical protein
LVLPEFSLRLLISFPKAIGNPETSLKLLFSIETLAVCPMFAEARTS